jgi:hypothetical protein
LIHGCCSDALLSRANTGTLRKMTAVPLSGNKAESPRRVELDCLHGRSRMLKQPGFESVIWRRSGTQIVVHAYHTPGRSIGYFDPGGGA